MAIPGWAFGLGAAIKAPEMANDWVGLYKNIRDMGREDDNEAAARASVENIGWAAQETDPRVRLENLREVGRDMSGRRLKADTLLKLQKEVDPLATAATKEVQANQQDVDLRRFASDAETAGMDLVTYAMKNPSEIPFTALEKANGVFSTLQRETDKEIARRTADETRADEAGFRNSITGLAGRSTDPSQLKRFANTDGYDPAGADDIRAAAAAYPRVKSEVVNQEVDNYTKQMERTPAGAPRLQKLRAGDATQTQMVQDFVLGGAKPVGGSVTNHPRQPAGSTDAGQRPIRVSWVAADGTPNSAVTTADDLPTLTASLQAQGVKWIDQVDGKRAVNRKTLIPEKKVKSGWGSEARPGGAAPAASVQVTRDASGRLVVKR